eukprot:3530161-Amphidinium_carterae.1
MMSMSDDDDDDDDGDVRRGHPFVNLRLVQGWMHQCRSGTAWQPTVPRKQLWADMQEAGLVLKEDLSLRRADTLEIGIPPIQYRME